MIFTFFFSPVAPILLESVQGLPGGYRSPSLRSRRLVRDGTGRERPDEALVQASKALPFGPHRRTHLGGKQVRRRNEHVWGMQMGHFVPHHGRGVAPIRHLDFFFFFFFFELLSSPPLTRIGDSAAKELGDLVSGCAHLRRLDLSGNQLGDAVGGVQIVEVGIGVEKKKKKKKKT